MARKWPRILFFIIGSLPTEEQIEEAESLGFNVVFRNASFSSDEGALEICDGVTGEVPKRYAEKYPSAEEVIDNFKAGSKKPELKEGENPFDAETIKKIGKVKNIADLYKFQVDGRSAVVEAAINAKGNELDAKAKEAAAKANEGKAPVANASVNWTPNS